MGRLRKCLRLLREVPRKLISRAQRPDNFLNTTSSPLQANQLPVKMSTITTLLLKFVVMVVSPSERAAQGLRDTPVSRHLPCCRTHPDRSRCSCRRRSNTCTGTVWYWNETDRRSCSPPVAYSVASNPPCIAPPACIVARYHGFRRPD